MPPNAQGTEVQIEEDQQEEVRSVSDNVSRGLTDWLIAHGVARDKKQAQAILLISAAVLIGVALIYPTLFGNSVAAPPTQSEINAAMNANRH